MPEIPDGGTPDAPSAGTPTFDWNADYSKPTTAQATAAPAAFDWGADYSQPVTANATGIPEVGVGETALNAAVNAVPFGKQLTDLGAATTYKLGLEALDKNRLRFKPDPSLKGIPGAIPDAPTDEPTTQAAARLEAAQKEGFGDVYRRLRDTREVRDTAGADQHPIPHALGKAGGIGLSLLAPLPGFKGGKGALSAVPGLKGAALAGGLNGGIYSGIGGVTGSDALTHGDVPEALKDGAVSAAVGAPLGAAVGSVADVVTDKMPGVLRAFGQRLGLRSAGTLKSDLMRETPAVQKELQTLLVDRGHVRSTPDKVLESVQKDLGDQAQKWGAETGFEPLASGKITPTTPAKQAESVLSDFRDTAGAKVGEHLKNLDGLGRVPDYGTILKKLDDFEKADPAATQFVQSEIDRLRTRLYEMAGKPANAAGRAGNGFEALNRLKTVQQDRVNWKDTTTDDAVKSAQAQLSGVLRGAVDDEAEKHLSAGALKAFQEAKRISGLAIEAHEAVSKAANLTKDTPKADAHVKDVIGDLIQSRGGPSDAVKLYPRLSTLADIAKQGSDKKGNNILSLPTLMMGIMGAVGGAHGGTTESALWTTAAMLAGAAGKKYGPWAGSKVATGLSKIVPGIPNAGAALSPEAIQRLRDWVQSAPPAAQIQTQPQPQVPAAQDLPVAKPAQRLRATTPGRTK